MAHPRNPRIQEVEMQRLRVQGHPWVHSKTLCHYSLVFSLKVCKISLEAILVHPVALFIRNMQKPPTCLFAGEWLYKLWHIHTVEYYSAWKRWLWLLFIYLYFWDRVSLCSLDWPDTHSWGWTPICICNPPASVFQVLRLMTRLPLPVKSDILSHASLCMAWGLT